MRVLVACEFSGIVRDAFIAKGHRAISCDFLPTESPGPHYQRNVLDLLHYGWDMMIAFPPCTYLASSGARWWKDKQEEQQYAIHFVRMLMEAPIPAIAIENPIGRLSSAIRKPDQIIHPWMFGHGETKATCLWLKNLPPLMAVFEGNRIMMERVPRVHLEPPSPDRWKRRSITYNGIANAMAQQWG